MLAGGVLASLDGPGGFRTVMESLIDGLVAVEEGVASFLRLSLFAVFVVGIDSPVLNFAARNPESKVKNRSLLRHAKMITQILQLPECNQQALKIGPFSSKKRQSSSLSLNSKRSGILSARLVSTGLGDVRDVGHSILLVTSPTNAKELKLVLGTEQLKVTHFRCCGKYYSENRNHQFARGEQLSSFNSLQHVNPQFQIVSTNAEFMLGILMDPPASPPIPVVESSTSASIFESGCHIPSIMQPPSSHSIRPRAPRRLDDSSNIQMPPSDPQISTSTSTSKAISERETLDPEEKANYGSTLRHEPVTFVDSVSGDHQIGDNFKNTSSAALDKKWEEDFKYRQEGNERSKNS